MPPPPLLLSATATATPATDSCASREAVFFFDIDNCLYPLSTNINATVISRIQSFCLRHGIAGNLADTEALRQRYYHTYGLTIKGLLKHHEGIDPVEFDREVDGGLPLEDMLEGRDEALAQILQELAVLGVRRWAFTNAGIAHAERVLDILGVRDCFEGITYCRFEAPDFPIKPEPRAFRAAMHDAGVLRPGVDVTSNRMPTPTDAFEATTQCYLVDDSEVNLVTAEAFGWTTVHVEAEPSPGWAGGRRVIESIHDLPKALPQLWAPKGM